MTGFIENNEALLLTLGLFSAISFVATLILVPWIVVRLPADYFAKSRREPLVSQAYPAAIQLVVRLGKNLLGVVIIALGALMMVLPGQGLLTILIGVLLIDFPGKYGFERWLIQRKPILRSVNWLRQNRQREPLKFQGFEHKN